MSTGLKEYLESLKGKKCAVIGMGVSNTPLIRMLLDAKISVLVCDKKTEHKEDILAEFEAKGASFSFGEDYLSKLSGVDVIFKTPGMRYDVKELLEAEKNGSVVTTEMEQFLRLCPCTCIGVTGSDGKTTTTTIVGKLLERAGKTCYVGGNIGTPLLPKLDRMKEGDFSVVELSSFQLMNIKFSPTRAVITNITPNHLDVHKSFEEYASAKEAIFDFSDGIVVLNSDNEETSKISKKVPARSVMFSSKEVLENGYCVENGYIVKRTNGESEKIVAVSDIKIPGMHNVENYMAAIAVTEGFVSKDDICYVAKNFGGVEHRMELVREISGVKVYNDSIASSPTRTIAGLRAFNRKVILIAGGYDKKIPFDVLGDAALEYVKCLVLVGATSEKIKDAVENTPGYKKESLPIIMCKTLEEAAVKALEAAESGDIVTLSPACASFDMFENFMVRGNRFKEIINSL